MSTLLAQLKKQGFDQSYELESGGVKVCCSQCEACCINNVACHERHCPNTKRMGR